MTAIEPAPGWLDPLMLALTDKERLARVVAIGCSGRPGGRCWILLGQVRRARVLFVEWAAAHPRRPDRVPGGVRDGD